MPGIGELIEGAMQQAPQPGRQPMEEGGEVIPQVYPSQLDSPQSRVYIS
jgi:hypothetical protein